MIRWRRTTMKVDGWSAPLLVYTTEEKDWAAWSIDRIPQSNGSRTCWYDYQPKYHGAERGPRRHTLRDAKRFVERHV